MTRSTRDLPGQVATLAAGRDRVLDAAKAFALLVVVVAHSIAWDVSTGTPASVLDLRPDIAWATWTLQILPLFFAAGAVGNLGSWNRRPEAGPFLGRRLLRLGTPGLLYSAFWTALLLPLVLVVPLAEFAGKFLSQLVWFLGVYGVVVVAVPWTARWVRRPVLALGLWLGAIAVVDALRWNVAPVLGWLNLLLVWGFVHQVGYHLPALRRLRPVRLVGGSLVSIGAAVALAVVGPYSASMVSYAGDPEPSNLSPPTLVVALYGLGLVLVLAALWPALTRLLAHDRLYLVVGAFGSRAVGIYLWHIPLMALVAGAAWGLGFAATPLSAPWWAVHALGFVFVLTAAWFVAGLAGRGDRVLRAWGAARPRRALPVLPFAVAVPLVLLSISPTGFGTWWGPGMLGLPSSSAVNLAVLAAAWWGLAVGRAEARVGGPAVSGADRGGGPAEPADPSSAPGYGQAQS